MLKKRVVLLVSALVVISAFFWFYSHALLEIRIDGAAAKEPLNKRSQKATAVKPQEF